MTAALQHYLSDDDEIREPFLVCRTFGLSSGTRTINSSSLQSRASQMRSKCSRLTLSTNSWYNSLIVFGRMPVALAKSDCVHLSSPSLVDSKILIIRRRSFRYKISFFDTLMCLLLFYSGLSYILSYTDKRSGIRSVQYLPIFFIKGNPSVFLSLVGLQQSPEFRPGPIFGLYDSEGTFAGIDSLAILLVIIKSGSRPFPNS